MWPTLKPHFTIIKVKINMKDEWSSARGLLEFHCGQILCAVLSRSVVSNSLQPQGPWAARLLCPSGFSRQQYCSGLPCRPPGDHPNSGIEPRSPALQAYSLPSELPGKLISTQIEHELY